MFGIETPMGRTPFRARRLMSFHPGLKHPTSQSLRRGWLFGVTYHNMRGAIASATAAWAILLDRSAVARKRPNYRDGTEPVPPGVKWSETIIGSLIKTWRAPDPSAPHCSMQARTPVLHFDRR